MTLMAGMGDTVILIILLLNNSEDYLSLLFSNKT